MSEHKSQTFMYDIKDDIKYDIILHDFKVCIPTFKNALGRALPKSLLAASSSASSKLVTVICSKLVMVMNLKNFCWIECDVTCRR